MTLLRPGRRGSTGDALKALLEADRFRLGRDTTRVAGNLSVHGGTADPRAAVFIGSDLPPLGVPSVTLGAARGTIGPHSFGFLDNRRGVAPLAAPLPVRPRQGPIALVCGRRDALPDIAPMCVSRGLGVSWIVSAGDGEPDELLHVMAADEATRAVLISSPALRPGSLARLGGKKAVVLGGDPLVRAAVRRAGGVAADDLEGWLAHAALLEAGATHPEQPAALVLGGGAALVEEALRAGGLSLPVRTVPDEEPDEIGAAMAEAAQDADLLLVIGAERVPHPLGRSLFVDIGHLERVRALAAAIVSLREVEPAAPVELPAERSQARAILEEAGGELLDHDSKRLLKCYGVRVSRQAPASSPTAALRVGAQIGLPVDVVVDAVGAQARERKRPASARAATNPELRRMAALMLDEGLPYVLVREAFPAAPRVRLVIRRERGVGLCASVSTGAGSASGAGERALLPFDRADASLLARAALASDEGRGKGGRAHARLVDLLLRVGSCASENDVTLELEVYAGEEPAVVSASGRRARSC